MEEYLSDTSTKGAGSTSLKDGQKKNDGCEGVKRSANITPMGEVVGRNSEAGQVGHEEEAPAQKPMQTQDSKAKK